MAFPTTPLDFRVEVALGADLTADPSDWVWTDATTWVQARGAVGVMRGSRNGSVQAPPSTMTFVADNADGRWCPDNPTGAWYGQLSENTPVRVVTDEVSTSVRWTGFLTSLPPRWAEGELDRYVPVTASGILQRLQRGKTPVRSPLVRAIASTWHNGSKVSPKAYWPGEEGSAATTIAEFFGGRPMTWVNDLSPAADGPAGSLPVVEFTSAAGVQGVVSFTTTGKWQVGALFNLPAAPPSTVVLLRWTTNGTYPTWQVTLSLGSPDSLTLEAYDTAGALQISSAMAFGIPSGSGNEPYGKWIYLTVAAQQDGADVDHHMVLTESIAGVGQSGTATSITAGTVTRLGVPATTKLDGLLMGHWAVWDDAIATTSFPFDPAAIAGFAGETVLQRASRFNTEDFEFSIELDAVADTITMGPQIIGTPLDIARGFETASGGRLYENRDPTAFNALLHLKLADDMTNQAAALTLNRTVVGHLVEPFEPTFDDQYRRNDWTTTRTGASDTVGSSARVVADSGRYTPAKVGTYDDSVNVNVETDDQLADQAGWRVNIGTAEGPRFPVVTFDLHAAPALIAQWLTCDIGSRVRITNPPTGLAPDPIDLIIEGWIEVFDALEWKVQLFCSPYKPWHVIQLAQDAGDTDPFLGRLAGDEKAALRAAITSTATGAQNFDPNFYRWTTTADDFPLNIRMGGEVITLSGISTSAATFVAAGAASHADNAAVTPALYAGGAVRQLIIVFAAIRSSGTGTLQTPAGYRRLPIFNEGDNVQVFAKVHTGTESNPTITPSGGAAGDTVSAFTFGFSGTPSTLGTAPGTSLDDIVLDTIVQLNASAQNIGYGGLYAWRWAGNINLIFGWKQDDYTSVAVPTGYTEILEASTVTGNDQSLYAAYRIDTTPAVTVDSSLAVTGGASAISRSAVVALAGGIQVMTISARSVNGVVKSHAAGALIEVEDPAVLAL